MKTLIKLFWQIILGKGIKKSSQDAFYSRNVICRKNYCGDYKRPLGIKLLEKCGDCGCFLQAKNRIDEPYIECPKGFW